MSDKLLAAVKQVFAAYDNESEEKLVDAMVVLRRAYAEATRSMSVEEKADWQALGAKIDKVIAEMKAGLKPTDYD